MKLIKINKIILILAFFMPFTATMCSRSEILNMGNAKEEKVNETIPVKTTEINYFSYLLYPTESSASGFAFTYISFEDVFGGEFKFEFYQLIPLAFICSIFSLIFTFLPKPRLSFYISVLNVVSLLGVAIFVLIMEKSLDKLFDIMLWGFWLAIIVSMIDVFLTKRKAYS